MPPKPTYTLHTSFRIRRVAWRPESQTEIAVAAETGLNTAMPTTISTASILSDISALPVSSINHSSPQSATDSSPRSAGSVPDNPSRVDFLPSTNPLITAGNELEIWDVRRGWVNKWSIEGGAAEGGISGEHMRLICSNGYIAMSHILTPCNQIWYLVTRLQSGQRISLGGFHSWIYSIAQSLWTVFHALHYPGMRWVLYTL